MKTVARFNSKTQVHLASQALLNVGIKSETIGSRDYSSIIVGSDDGRYDLMVDWSDETEARRIVDEIQNQLVLVSNDSMPTPNLFLKKAIVFALLAAAFLPLIFNYVSLKNLLDYLKQTPGHSKKIGVTLLILLLQVPAVILIYILFKNFISN